MTLSTTNYTINGCGAGPCVTQSVYGGACVAFTPACGNLDQFICGCGAVHYGGLVLSGLCCCVPARHTIKVTLDDGCKVMNASAADVITPIHARKDIGNFALQATRQIGSQAISDLRKFEPIESCKINITQAIQIEQDEGAAGPCGIPLGNLRSVIITSGKPIEIAAHVTVSNSSANLELFIKVYVDGIQVLTEGISTNNGTNDHEMLSLNYIHPVAAGTHVVQVWMRTNSGSADAEVSGTHLHVRELL